MISLILVIIAAACNATMDNISHHGYKSVFSKFAPEIWNPNESWNQKNLTSLPDWWSDMWHRFKTIMLICLIGAISISFYDYLEGIGVLGALIWKTLGLNGLASYKCLLTVAIFVKLGGAWIITFNLFYNKILIKK